MSEMRYKATLLVLAISMGTIAAVAVNGVAYLFWPSLFEPVNTFPSPLGDGAQCEQYGKETVCYEQLNSGDFRPVYYWKDNNPQPVYIKWGDQ